MRCGSTTRWRIEGVVRGEARRLLQCVRRFGLRGTEGVVGKSPGGRQGRRRPRRQVVIRRLQGVASHGTDQAGDQQRDAPAPIGA